jgi:ferric-dicitrate binding protein FerR (iron transport regulator)
MDDETTAAALAALDELWAAGCPIPSPEARGRLLEVRPHPQMRRQDHSLRVLAAVVTLAAPLGARVLVHPSGFPLTVEHA